MSVDVQKSELFSELYLRQVIQLNKIDQVHKLMQRVSTEERELLQPLAEQLRELFLADIVSIIHMDSLSETAYVRAHIGFFANCYPSPGNLYAALHSAMPGMDVRPFVKWHKRSGFDTPVTRHYHVEHAVFVPIRSSNGTIFGALTLYRCYDTEFAQEDIALLVDIAVRLGDYLYGERVRTEEKQRLRILESMNQMVLDLNHQVNRLNDLPRFLQTSLGTLFGCGIQLVYLSNIEQEGIWQLSEIKVRMPEEMNDSDQCSYAGLLRISERETILLAPQSPLESFQVELFRMFWYYIIIYRDGLTLNGRLEWMATHDNLTGVWNRYGFFQELTNSVEKNNDAPLCLALMDIDNFKHVNDNLGHQFGDVVLQVLSSRVASLLEDESYVFARYGGEEFVLAGRNQPQRFAEMCELIRASIASETVAFEQKVIQTTVSIGIAIQPHSVNTHMIHRMLHRADEAMYQAKRSGKNRIFKL